MTQAAYLFRLHFSSPVQLGQPGIGLEGCAEHCPSDTLFGAIVHAWGLIFDKKRVAELLSQFEGGREPPFVLSSAFPFIKDTYFLPFPRMSPYAPLVPDDQRQTISRDVRFVEATLFDKWARLHGFTQTEAEGINKEPYKDASKEYLLPRARQDRVEGRTQLYAVGVREFADEAGLYFLLRTDSAEHLEKIEMALGLLTQLGLGGERAAGCGRFTFERLGNLPQELDRVIQGRRPPTDWCILSLYHPLLGERRRLKGYRLVERGGCVDSPFSDRQEERKRCHMLIEGSVVAEGDPVWGRLVDVTPDETFRRNLHPVYRFGLAFAVGI